MVRQSVADKPIGAHVIGEHEFAAGFHSFWSELLPLLTPACVAVINRQYGDYLQGYRPVDLELSLRTAGLDAPDLLAEVAFEVFRHGYTSGRSFRDVVEDRVSLGGAWLSATETISLHRRVAATDPPAVGSTSHRYLLAVGRRYAGLLELLGDAALEFSPAVPGCGILRACEGDIAAGSSLIEVKTVDRKFSSKDLRQVVVYLALRYLSGLPEWDEAILFNPRRSFFVRFRPDELIPYVAGGKTLIRVYREVEEYLVERDFVPDHGF